MTTVLVSGGAGFIGSNFVLHLLRAGEVDRVVNVDLLTYAGNLENLKQAEGHPGYRFVRGDVSDKASLLRLVDEPVDQVVHFAAESHVDRSILDAAPFLKTNVLGTQAMIDCCRTWGVERMVHVSTDEVYGDLGPKAPPFCEETALDPHSPYAASKAASDLLVLAAVRTHGFPGLVTRCSNNYGPRQFPEKLIPLMLSNALLDKPLPVYGDGSNVRDWIHVQDHCRAVDLVRKKGRPGRIYNIGGGRELRNLDVVKILLRAVGKPESLIRFVKDRPGHDRRYAIDAGRIAAELGFVPLVSFEEGIQETVAWYRNHAGWLERVRSGAYQEACARIYDDRLEES